ncbi:uncharacterized protein LOC105701381 isoform X2 [Orussus abietinus]|uniref:uncharacterized protein LOC105701381 isoform X2 n=1 Tax=Orussus abietinus TaxID=222816 RepID=UPI000625046E|nr:uncharacterized protein LOC105701381 isoform X2 [Orussus abietinus]XP_012283514.1 uncharacterized protein LOC105701381 isoform X2 [Orussus abietinus]XP_012283515.1 uncharacterized protein LOC105701381 isoform X2 [Orussus abietinus]
MRGSTGLDRLPIRYSTMDDSINPFEYRGSDCSGRSLVTLVVAWIGAAMVASVLLGWKYVWIAMTVLTMLFLIACGYAACTAKKVQANALSRAEMERRRRQVVDIETISGEVDGHVQIIRPPEYQTYWITDLPPPYSTIMGVSPAVGFPHQQPPEEANVGSDERRISNPPPYSVAVQSSPFNQQVQPMTQVGQTADHPEQYSSTMAQTSTHLVAGSQCRQIHPVNTLTLKLVPSLVTTTKEDKAIEALPAERSADPTQNTVISAGTSYITNIITCTFGRTQRRPADQTNQTREANERSQNN